MLRRLSCLLILLFIAACRLPAQIKVTAAGAKHAHIAFRDTVHDFGHIVQGYAIDYPFSFKNTGGEPLIITRCSTSDPHYADWPREPVMPGKSAAIVVHMSTAWRSGPFNKTITVHSNADEATADQQHRQVIAIKGFIDIDSARFGFLKAEPSGLFEMDTVRVGTDVNHTFLLCNVGRTPLRIASLERPYMHTDSNRVVYTFDTGLVPPGGVIRVRAHVNTTEDQLMNAYEEYSSLIAARAATGSPTTTFTSR